MGLTHQDSCDIVASVSRFLARQAKNHERLFFTALGLIMGGAIGNLIDRVRLGYVVDMLDTMFMDFPVFNVADVFVVCGTVCALIYYLAFYSKSDEKNWGNKVDGTDPAANK